MWNKALQIFRFQKNCGICLQVRLIALGVDLKKTNMTDDIPGVSFSEEEIGKLTIDQLKFWVKCRRINQNGNKKDLLER